MTDIQEYLKRETSLSNQFIRFVRYLRSWGFTCSVVEEEDCLSTMQTYFPQNIDEFYRLSKSLLVKTKQQHDIFDEYFEKYWFEVIKGKDAKSKNKAQHSSQVTKPKKDGLQSLKNWLFQSDSSQDIVLPAFSDFGNMVNKDFSNFSNSELNELAEIFREYLHRSMNQPSLRYKKTKHKKDVDLRKTVTQMAQMGGELLRFSFRTKKLKKEKIILLCDVSKSMDLYSRFLIQFLYGGLNASWSSEVFLFNTELIRATEFLRFGSYDDVLRQLSREEMKWSEGTKIGDSLSEFAEEYSTLYRQNATIIIVSDGIDTGSGETFKHSMETLRERSKQMIWLNPLMSNPSYEPKTACMQEALPFLDYLGGIHSVDSVIDFLNYLRVKT